MPEERAQEPQDQHRWRGRRVQAWLVRALTYLIPLGASVGAGAVLSRILPTPAGIAQWVSWWTVMLSATTAVLIGADRLARRLLPLAALLKLSLIFPDQAPSRFRVAVRAGGTRKLEQKLEDVKAKGLEHTPAEAAATVLELASMLNVHDRKTRGHSERVRVFSDLLADEIKLAKPDRDRLHWAALLHDVGKLVVPHEILNKAGKPTDEEWAILRSHPLEGERFVAPLADWLGEWSKAIGQHHEKYDGTGYPRGLAGQDIAMAARIVAVADSYEVMTAARAYKRPMPAAEARRELARCAGTQFDPMVVRAFLNISVGKLRLGMGPLSWLAQLPFAQFLPQVGTAASTAAGTAVATASTAAAMVLGGVVEAPKYTPAATAAAEDAEGDLPRGDSGPPATFEPTTVATVPDPVATSADAKPKDKKEKKPPVAADDDAVVNEDEPVQIRAMANDVPGDGPLNPSTITMTKADGGSARAEGGGVIYFVPAPDRNGIVQFGYRVCDDNGLCDDASVTVRIVPVNDPPVARSDAAMTGENRPVGIPVLGNDSDVDGDAISVVSAFAAVGSTTVNPDGTLTYVPKKDWEGTDEVRYLISDPTGATATGVVTVVVDGKNDDPEAAPDAATTAEDTPVSVPVTANDRDPDDDPLRVSAVGRPANGAATAAGGSVTYTPKKDWHGVDSFTYTVEDGRGGVAASTVTVTVKPVNDPPVAVEDRGRTAEDTKVAVDVLANDRDPDTKTGDELKVTGVAGATFGDVVVGDDGTIVYTPKPDAYGVETLTYTVTDKEGATATSTVVLTVTPVNDAPIAKNVFVDAGMDEPLIALTMDASDPKDEGRPGAPAPPITAYEILSTPPAGTLYYDSDAGTGESYLPAVAGVKTSNPVVRFTPPAGQSGTFAFTYRALDGGHPLPGEWTAPAAGTYSISDSRLLVAYEANGSGAVSLGGASVHGVAYVFLQDHPGLAGADFWLDDPAMTGAPHSSDGATRFDFNGGNPWDTGILASGPHTITARVQRTDGTTFVLNAPFTVVPNALPVAVADDVQVDEDGQIDIEVLANDSDGNGDVLTPIAVTAPSRGTATIKPDGRVRYTPAADWFGTDSFTYTVEDGHGGTATATVRVTVLPIPDAPVAVGDGGDANLLGTRLFNVLGNDTDPDGDIDPGSVTIIRQPNHGSVIVNPDGTILYQADLLAGDGVDGFRYRVCDSTGQCSAAEVRVGFNNDAPDANADVVGTSEDLALTTDIVANDTDPDSWDQPVILSVAQPANGTVTIDNDRKRVTYTPNPNWSGVDTFTYTITDGRLTDTATVTVNVAPVNDPPVAVDDAVTTVVDQPVLIDVVANDTDADGDPLTVVQVDNPTTKGTTSIAGNQVQYTPNAGVNGTDTFTYTVSDGTATSTATIRVTINALPVAVDDAASVDEDGSEIAIFVLDNDSDPEGAQLTITGAGGTAKGTVTVDDDHLHYLPNPNAYGTDSITYSITDGTSTVTGMVTITINPKPDDPVAMDDDVVTPRDQQVIVDVLANDIDPDGDLVPGSVVVQNPSNGTVSVDPATGRITYTPTAGWTGTETFNYDVCDANGKCDQGQVRVTVRNMPGAVQDSDTTTAGNAVLIPVLNNDVVGDAPITTVTVATAPTNGTAVVAADEIQYRPNPGFTGTDSFTYTITDADGYTSTATVTVTVV